MAKKAASKTAGKPRPKSEVYREIAQTVGVARKDVAGVFDALSSLIKKDLSKRGPGIFTIPGLVKIKVVSKPATKARQGVNPFTGETMMFKAKPARRVVKAQALKGLKAMV
ncbi:MAG TPA: HU family DNA-binding protein [Phycisphaerae bacterium]|nr:HU family DNA-binding protein [Phycisphaerae bacterium]HNU43886.1 HU family DNA-binding protein [Phycisphaerae bacterium]